MTEIKAKKINPAGWLVLAVLFISIPVLIISSTVNIYAHSPGLYRYGFNKYEISAATGISDIHLEGVAQNMVDYFSGKLVSPQMAVEAWEQPRLLYNQKELTHLEDVRYIISVFKMLQTAAILAFLASGAAVFAMLGIRRLLRGILAGAIVTVALMTLLTVWSLIDFYSLFYLFHIVSFSNELWLLDPSKDYLIMMFTESFFYDAAIMVTATIIAEAVILGLAVLVIEKMMLNRRR
ncbi:MAG: TIGR01906 family membrane protein [Dehalococcoidia bacterium]